MERKQVLRIMRDYFKDQEDIILAFLFGSMAKGKASKRSDVDIALYFKDSYDLQRVDQIKNELEEATEDRICQD